MQHLDFSLPPLRQPGADEPLPRSGAVQAWVADLPMAHAGQLSQRLFASLNASRELALKEPFRIELLEALREPLSVVQTSLRGHFRHQPLPLPAKTMKVFHLSTSLFLAMAQSWLRLLESEPKRSWLSPNKGLDNHALAAQRAIRALGEVLDNYHHLHLAAPRGLWRLLHNTLRAADAQGVAQRQPALKGEACSSALSEYSRQLLLSQLPYQQIATRHLQQVYARLDEWAGHAQLEPGTGFNDQGGLYVYLDSDMPPITPGSYYQRVDEQQARADRYFLNLGELLELLEHGEPGLDEELRHCLLLKWRAAEGRDERHPEEGSNVLHYGISGIFHFLKAQEEALRAQQQPEEAEAEEEQKESYADFGIEGLVPEDADERLEGTDVWDKVYITAEARHWSERFAQEEPMPPQDAELRNRSRGGICVSADTGRHSCFRCGELVAVDDGSRLRLGALRWLRGEETTRVELGIQWLADAPQPVFLRIGAQDGPSQPALLAHDQGHGLLLVPRIPSLESKAIWLEYADELRQVDTREPFTGSNHFLAYRCSVADESIDALKRGAEGEFAQLWQEI